MTSLWLTRIVLDTRHPMVRGDLRDAGNLHRRVMSLLPDGIGPSARQQAGLLFRLESTRRGPYLLVQSALEPNTSRLPDGYGTARTIDLASFLAGLRSGALVHYRIAANTSKRLANPDRHKPGKVVALRGEQAQQWWVDRAGDHGLNLRTTQTVPQPDLEGTRADRRVRHAITRFDGIGVVTDPERLRVAVRAGVGRGKSHGCGLLSLASVRNTP